MWTGGLISVLVTLSGLQIAYALDLNATLGDVDARQAACANYRLSRPYDNQTYSTAFLGPSRNVVVGPVNYTYYRFGPLLDSGDQGDSNNTLVLIVGSAATLKVWPADLLRPLAAFREVVTFNLPGIGSNTTVPSDQLGLDAIAQSLLGFFEALNLNQPDILGWSWGGYLALYLGTAYGESVGSLVLVSTSAGGDGLFRGEYSKLNITPPGKDVPNAVLFPNTADGNFGLCRWRAFLEIMPSYIPSSDQILNQSSVSSQALPSNIVSDNLDNITNPVLIVHAEEDLSLSFDNAVYLYNNISQSYLLSRKYAGHAFLLQDSSYIVPIMEQFPDYYDYFDDEDFGDTDTAADTN